MGHPMKAGDRVRITVEGKIIYIASDGYVRVLYDDARHGETSFTLSELTAPTARVEVLPPPIEVGDRVKDHVGQYFNVEAVVGVHVLCADIDSNVPFGRNFANLTLVSKASKAGGRV